ncbi:acyl-CoA dehydrogenase family protein [Streptomyces sp. NPDC059010]|uniref:acyl-CoA dehydrogenase family protein n=1 Tax=Streptomyces sp. NPDC059010 TaxID=3346695 RepID=UPI0036A8C554
MSRRRADEQIAWLRDYAPRRINSQLIDERRCIPPYIVQDFGTAGLFGPLIEERHGGTALRFVDMFRVFEQLMAIDTALGTWLCTSLFPGTRALSVWAGEQVKQQWLPLLASGRTLGAYAQTEPGAGSDFTHLSTIARPAHGGWLLNGSKHLIGNGTWAAISTVLARPQRTSGSGSSLIALAVPTALPGVYPGEEHLTLGQRGMVQSRMHFVDVTVPDSHVLADGDGRAVAMDSMSASRLGVAAFALGALKRVIQIGSRFAARRSTGGLVLKDRAWVRAWLAETIARADILEALVYNQADRLDAGQVVEIEGVVTAKVLGAEWAVEAADVLVQLMGGLGYDEANMAARMYRDLRVYRIFEGPSEALCDFLGRRALRQTAQVRALIDERCGPGLGARFAAALEARRTRTADVDEAPDAPHAPIATALMWTLAAGALSRPTTPYQAHARTVADWHLQHALEQLCSTASPSPLNSDALLEAAVGRYQQRIGDLAQHLPGARTTPDELTQPASPDTASP